VVAGGADGIGHGAHLRLSPRERAVGADGCRPGAGAVLSAPLQYRSPARRQRAHHRRRRESRVMPEARQHGTLTPAQRLAWLRLFRSDNVGPVTFRQLLNRFGSAEAALEALPALSRKAGRAARLFSQAQAED